MNFTLLKRDANNKTFARMVGANSRHKFRQPKPPGTRRHTFVSYSQSLTCFHLRGDLFV